MQLDLLRSERIIFEGCTENVEDLFEYNTDGGSLHPLPRDTQLMAERMLHILMTRSIIF